MDALTDRPEMAMIRRARVPAALASAVAVALGWALGGPGVGASAGIGVALVALNFAAHGWSLAWASTVSTGVVMGVALGGFLLRLGVVVGTMYALHTLPWFSPTAFGLTVMPATLLLLGFEARLAVNGLGGTLQIPADPAAAAAASVQAAREAS